MDRRDFCRAAITIPFIASGSVFGEDAPSNLLNMAIIGTGRMGHLDMKACLYQGLKAGARIVAVCDVDRDRAKHAKAEVEKIYTEKLGAGNFGEVALYGDYRKVLERDDVDGVTISTPEHWHALIAIAAAEAGKDCYVQKPITYSIVEGQKLVKAVRKNKIVLQTGSQQRSSVYFRKVCELARNGNIGKLEQIEVVVPTDHGRADAVESPIPENLNYDMWLGPTVEMPYIEQGVHPKKGYGRPGWLQIERYCRGMITGWGAHMYDIAQWGLGVDTTSGPIEVQATGEFPDRGLFDVHVGYSAEAKYANGVKLVSHNGSAGVKFIGSDGWLWVQRGSFNASDRNILREDTELKLPVSKNHMLNFLECMKSRKDPIAPVEAGHRSNSVCVIHHIAMKLGRKLKWDPKAERFIGDDEANSMLDYPYREPWRLG